MTRSYRYMAIIKPLQPRMGRKLTLLVALGTWLIGVLMGIPYLLYFTTYTIEEENNRILCYMEWPDGISNESYQEYIFNVVFLVVTYVVPILSMMFTYARIGLELWGSQSIGEITQRQMDNIKSKRRHIISGVIILNGSITHSRNCCSVSKVCYADKLGL
ncbi:unnamed protein product [Acanthoscelides obtectus]|uniref:G-protein coupled receptors family 1 profile domain-containing protein n=1 Tax=Acanthoscelides obtectus TaxID=200917 RepID=A0A9P0NWF8_ACAOB|nr:unnamed protein product [Acanthoscelides obtectus]CAK1663837.1 Tachykinin-like peptides receptor 99D [Acanthoscelides obtectus]